MKFKFVISVLKQISISMLRFTWLFFSRLIMLVIISFGMIGLIFYVPNKSYEEYIRLLIEIIPRIALFSIQAGLILGLFFGTISHYLDNYKKL